MRGFCGLLVAVCLTVPVCAAEIDYARDVASIFKKRCVVCHGPLTREGGLRLDAGKLARAGGDDGAVIVSGDPAASRLLSRVTSTDVNERMPPKGAPLSAGEIDLLSRWIASGAAIPAQEVVVAAPRDHWSFQPLRPQTPPEVRDPSWALNPIDRFVRAELERVGRTPNPPASWAALLRRAHLDLHGLPPSIAVQEAFARNADEEAYASLIRDLLADSAYGERYARHWLDVARYADSNGYERDAEKPQVWRYRDYVIRAFNDDKPFDRFIREQLAGDELPNASAESVIATGFLRLGPWDDEPADPETDKFDQWDDLISTTSQTFLGLTLGCARCHDHKFDPLTQRDYYSLLAVFQPLDRPRQGRTELATPAAAPQIVRRLNERDAGIATENAVIAKVRREQLAELIASQLVDAPDGSAAAFETEEAKRTDAQKKLVRDLETALRVEVDATLTPDREARIRAAQNEIKRLHTETPDVVSGYFLRETSSAAPPTRLLHRGNPRDPGAEVQPAAPAVLCASPVSFPPPDAFTSRRRITLADWIAAPDHPLTARVIVNRVWLWHFGRGLVRTPNDFGLQGEQPTHPALLDWLAHWFTHDAGWSLKKLHLLIMTSRSYQMSREGRADLLAVDPENRTLWRRAPQRLEVEAMRDATLAVSGQLDRTLYGPAMYPFIPSAAVMGHTDKERAWPKFDERASSRRAIYAFTKRTLLVPMFEVFDQCDTTRSAGGRGTTTVPTQALSLFNGDFVNRQAVHFADRLRKEVGDDPAAQIDHAYRLALARKPTEREAAAMRAFLERESLSQLCRVIFNLNEFVYPE